MALPHPVTGMKTAQLLPLLANLGVSRGGLDSVWEKEVTGSMLCEFCEEDIRDVFTEFKDRFLIRKLLRDLFDKAQSRHKPATLPQSDSHHGQIRPSEGHDRSPTYSSQTNVLSGLAECYADLAQAAIAHRNASSDSASRHPSTNQPSSPLKRSSQQSLQSHDVVEINDEEDSVALLVDKKPHLDEIQSVRTIPSHEHSLESSAGKSTGQHSVHDSFAPKQLSPFAVFVNKPELTSVFGSAFSHFHAAFGNADEQRQTRASHLPQTDQALCLKKTVGPAHVRNDTPSPATQPSSTTPDSFIFQESKHLDLASTTAMSQLATKYSAPDILSKKAQRSRPSGAQKLGSVLIRNAAQQADLWETAPCLRSIAQFQKQCFLSYVYSIAPQLKEYEQLLWQRLSETLQNRRKYLLDKKLGKRGVHTNGEQASPSDILGNFNWNVTPQILSNLGHREDTRFTHEDSATEESNDAVGIVKREPEQSFGV